MELWDRLENETSLAYEWFCRYRDYGRERSHVVVVEKYGKKKSYLTQVGRWSKKYNWVKRVEAYDFYLENKIRDSLEDERLTAAKKHIVLADIFYNKVLEGMKSISPHEISPKNLTSMADFAVKTERDALGIASEFKITNDVNVRDKTTEKVFKSVMDIADKILALRTSKVEE